jgi:hypothetical protein
MLEKINARIDCKLASQLARCKIENRFPQTLRIADSTPAKKGHDRMQAASAHAVPDLRLNRDKTHATTNKIAPVIAVCISPK